MRRYLGFTRPFWLTTAFTLVCCAIVGVLMLSDPQTPPDTPFYLVLYAAVSIGVVGTIDLRRDDDPEEPPGPERPA